MKFFFLTSENGSCWIDSTPNLEDFGTSFLENLPYGWQNFLEMKKTHSKFRNRPMTEKSVFRDIFRGKKRVRTRSNPAGTNRNL
ncbi:hypothetical protein LEP1GSC058_3694 [Leptospira fainei serovar Hurstbridge str. BUT 6]|uniref:Uncharacterized protein n=1 Tax=Leptospira fainei serovar Hurstbridge str. BUT 6 TaxID=1193011 RepID=S3V1T0_9LEPT|nr:hypothetical protein LEP1GSC058_3694 [Leptospira fainei serovar Hurstbridge str. BUT 6]